MSERVSDEYLTRIIEQKAGVMPMHLALDLRDARTSLDVLRRNGINAFCLSVDEAKDPHRACAALRAERDAALAESEARRCTLTDHWARIQRLEAEVERMRPVVEAACDENEDTFVRNDDESFTVRADYCERLMESLDTFRASAQKEGKP